VYKYGVTSVCVKSGNDFQITSIKALFISVNLRVFHTKPGSDGCFQRISQNIFTTHIPLFISNYFAVSSGFQHSKYFSLETTAYSSSLFSKDLYILAWVRNRVRIYFEKRICVKGVKCCSSLWGQKVGRRYFRVKSYLEYQDSRQISRRGKVNVTLLGASQFVLFALYCQWH
jgi:hypothetical protein